MAIARISITCDTCGKVFEHRHESHNRHEANSYEDWAKANITTCPECKRKASAADAQSKLQATLTRLGITLPALEGVSDKQVNYAISVRDRYLACNIKDITRYHKGMQAMADPAARAQAMASCEAAGISYEDGLEITLRSAHLYDVHLALTSSSARAILDKFSR